MAITRHINLKYLKAAVMAGGVLFTLPSLSVADTAFSPEQTENIEEIVRQYLLDHPEIILESVQKLEERRRVAEEEQRRKAIAEARAELEDDPDAPFIGNHDASVVLVEFFDYRCPYCRRVVPLLQQALAENDDIKLVMKEYPILSQESVQGARAALAARKQGKYEDFHFALMENPADMSRTHIIAVAESVGLDTGRLETDMRSKEIDVMLRNNYQLAESLGITGTPALIVGDTLIPGAFDLETLRELIAKTRAEAS